MTLPEPNEWEVSRTDKWISVEDRLPIISGYKLCWNKHRRGYVIWFNANKQRFDTSRPITHWMPLPEPPEQT